MMEEKFYHSDFEDLIKDKADQYKMYPSDKVWKNINKSLRSRKKWYWTGFVVLLSGISYISITELMKPPPARSSIKTHSIPAAVKNIVTTEQLIPFSSSLPKHNAAAPVSDDSDRAVITAEDSGTITASVNIPLQFVDAASPSGKQTTLGSLLIEGLEPLARNEVYNIEVTVPTAGHRFLTPAEENTLPIQGSKLFEPFNALEGKDISQDRASLKLPSAHSKRISWQLAFSPTITSRRLNGSDNAKLASTLGNIPLALQIQGNLNTLANHTPALGFELGTHGFLSLSNRITLKGGVQFNYSKYDIRAFHGASELATISLIPSAGRSLNSLTSYTDIRNFGGSAVDNLKNQYFQFSLPVGIQVKIFGDDDLQFDIAGTVQPTYLLNKNSYLITTDYKNYTRAPSLVRRWNMNAGVEAYFSYNHNGVKWQVGPQFRYQLFSSYDKSYPIKEYLMQYGIKIGITKTIR